MEIKETREIEIEQGSAKVVLAGDGFGFWVESVGQGGFVRGDLDDLIACLQEAKKQLTKEE